MFLKKTNFDSKQKKTVIYGELEGRQGKNWNVFGLPPRPGAQLGKVGVERWKKDMFEVECVGRHIGMSI